VQYQINAIGVRFEVSFAEQVILGFEFLVKHCDNPSHMREVLASKGINFAVFHILIDQKFPFTPPQIFCVSELSLYFELTDGRGTHR